MKNTIIKAIRTLAEVTRIEAKGRAERDVVRWALDARAGIIDEVATFVSSIGEPPLPRLGRVKEGVDPKRWLEEWKAATHVERLELLDWLRAVQVERA